MASTYTYPGVYIAEASSGVHTITGVATSIGAFFGQASIGPLNTPIECLSYSDYTRNFGPPVANAQLAQSVQQFFSNGGSDCFVVRLADGAYPAVISLNDRNGTGVLQVSANSPGVWGDSISLTVDYNTPTPDSTFNLQLSYNGSSGMKTESFTNLSMDPGNARYAPTYITQSSQYLTVSATSTTASGITNGYSEARGIIAVPVAPAPGDWNERLAAQWTAVDQGSFQISVDGGPWTPVNLSKTALTSAANSGSDAATFGYLTTQINLALGLTSGTKVAVSATPAGFLLITSAGTLKSNVQIRSASPAVDLAQLWLMGVNQGGIEVARYSDLRPVPTGMAFAPSGTGEILTAMDEFATANLSTLTSVTINGVTVPITFTLAGPEFWQGASATDMDGIQENLQAIANSINTGFPNKFQATVNGYRLFVQNLNPSLSSPTADTISFAPGGGGAAAFVGGFTNNLPAYSLGASAAGTYFTPGANAASDGNPPTQADYLGSQLNRTGFYALDGVDLFNLMVLPGDGIGSETEWQAVRVAAAGYCQSRRAFLILDAPVGWTNLNANLLVAQQSDIQNFSNAIGPDLAISCAVYYPQVQFNDGGTLRYVGPSGMIAGIYAATDATRGVWKAPAGTNAGLTGATGLAVILTDAQNGVLNPQAINCLRRMPAGYLVWGARTLAGTDNSGNSDFTYIPVRRMTLFLEESLYQGTQWAVFEPNAEPLWSQIRMNLGAFMMGLFTQGAFAGTTPSDSYFVKCDSETTTQADIDQGVVNIIVGFAPLEPAEFVVITIQQIAGSLS
jgi:phage tail sheath protein FI